VDCAFRQTGGAVAAGDLAAEHGADGAVHIADGEAGGDWSLRLQRGCGLGDELMIESVLKAVILRLHFAAGDTGGQRGRVEDGGEIDALGLPVNIGNGGIDFVDAANHFVDGAEAELGHVLAHLLGDEEEEVDDVLGLAGEART